MPRAVKKKSKKILNKIRRDFDFIGFAGENRKDSWGSVEAEPMGLPIGINEMGGLGFDD